MDWESYEGIVKDIYEKLGEGAGIEIICWGAACKVKGKSGVNHQIDVLASHSDGIHSYKTAIECKYWNNKVPKDAVTKLSEIIEDAHIEKGIVVSKSGFTQDAITFAQYKNIGLVELRKPTDEDWRGRIKDIHLRGHVWMPQVNNYEFIRSNINEKDADALRRVIDSTSALTSEIFIRKPGGESMSLHEMINMKLREDAALQNREEKTHSVPFPDGSMLFVAGSHAELPIKEIRFNVSYSHTALEEVVIRGEDHVFMIMAAIFENKRFVISPSGDIRESESLLGEDG